MERFESITTRALQACLLLMAFAAPISIAATQTAWAFALLFWIIRTVAVRPRIRPAAFDLAVLAFIALSLISSVFSYEPRVSLGKMAAVSLVTIVYLFAGNIQDRRMFGRVIVLLLVGCFAACLFAFLTFAVGKNLKVLRLAEDSPLRMAGIEENDTILKAGGRQVASPEQLAAVIAETPGQAVPIDGYRHELLYTSNIVFPLSDVSSLGIVDWSRGRDTRASGFYGQYVTFAEVLQLITSLALGLLLLADGSIFRGKRLLLLIAVTAFAAALFLTITRASWLAFLASAGVMLLIAARPRTLLILAACAVPFIIGGLIYLQQKRQVNFFDAADDSTAWRLTIWHEALNVIVSSPRHLAVGIGMDSVKTHWQDWQMFDNGRRPLGHMHSTPLQFAFERGIPALAAWIVWMFIYLKLLWGHIRRRDLPWPGRGVVLGALGGTVGFLTSGLVHYNWGDSEVVMVFYIIMGISLAVMRRSQTAEALC